MPCCNAGVLVRDFRAWDRRATTGDHSVRRNSAVAAAMDSTVKTRR